MIYFVYHRCRSCLRAHPSGNYRNISGPCYLDKTIKEAISQLVPAIVSYRMNQFKILKSDAVVYHEKTWDVACTCEIFFNRFPKLLFLFVQ